MDLCVLWRLPADSMWGYTWQRSIIIKWNYKIVIALWNNSRNSVISPHRAGGRFWLERKFPEIVRNMLSYKCREFHECHQHDLHK